MEFRSLSGWTGSLVRIGHRPPEPVVGGSNPSPSAKVPGFFACLILWMWGWGGSVVFYCVGVGDDLCG